MSRIRKENVSLDYDKTREFFEARARHFRGTDYRVITSYADKSPDISRQRDELEQRVLDKLTNVTKATRVLDIGCGAGRLAPYFAAYSSAYLGLDYSSALIDIAKKNFPATDERILFQVLSVDELSPEKLCMAPPFDLVLVTGLIAYLNEGSTDHLFAQLAEVTAPTSAIYLREPISVMPERLTLKDHFSEEMNCEYHAIYRTEAELQEYFERHLFCCGFQLVATDFLYPESLHKRAETKHKYFFLVRSNGE